MKNQRLKTWIYQRILPGLIAGSVKIINKSLRIEMLGMERVRELRNNNRRIVFVVWHGRHFMVIPSLRAPNASVLSSTSRDGKLLADVLVRFGYDIIPGSSHKSPVRALLVCIQKIKDGNDLILAVDGPTGPIHEFKPGALFVATKSDAVIVPLSYSSKWCVVFNSWDRFMLPLPFSKTVMIFGEPVRPSGDLSEGAVEKERLELQNTVNRLMDEADRKAGFIRG